MMSTRFALPLMLLVLAAAIPTAIHGYAEYVVHDGRWARHLPATLAGRYGRDTEPARRSDWVRRTYGSDDWIERDYNEAGQAPITLFVARTYDLKKVYHHPELGLLRGRDFDPTEVVRVGPAGTPVFLMRAAAGAGLAAYLLHYDGRPVANPLRVQIESVFTSLIGGRRPMTLFLAYDPQQRADSALEQTPVIDLLLASLDAFEAR